MLQGNVEDLSFCWILIYDNIYISTTFRILPSWVEMPDSEDLHKLLDALFLGKGNRAALACLQVELVFEGFRSVV